MLIQGSVVLGALEALIENDKWHHTYDDGGGYLGSELAEQNAVAISGLVSAVAGMSVPAKEEHQQIKDLLTKVHELEGMVVFRNLLLLYVFLLALGIFAAFVFIPDAGELLCHY